MSLIFQNSKREISVYIGKRKNARYFLKFSEKWD